VVLICFEMDFECYAIRVGFKCWLSRAEVSNEGEGKKSLLIEV
jgi:hypothetical protein